MKWFITIALSAILFVPRALPAAPEVGGVGIALAQDKDSKEITVFKVLPETPAAKNGVKPGWIINRIADVAIKGKTINDCVALIRGPVGSAVTLELVDPEAHKTHTLELKREALAGIVTTAAAKLGDRAGPVAIKEWVKGDKVDVTDGKNIYVLEFWATWCGPCRVSIPHLSQMQKKYKGKGVVFVGVSDEKPEVVRPFVEKMGDQMNYTVACDDSRKTSAAYMEAYAQNGIPTAFIVDKGGKVYWLGHPMAGLDKKLHDLTK